jgi:succinate-semialdehyde dehydrogenase/glutarate-semialdehyde dehydrogenase
MPEQRRSEDADQRRMADRHAHFPGFNPATGEEIGQVADGTEQDAARAIDAASAALPAWMNETAYARSAMLYRAYQLMLEQPTRAG